MPRPHKRQATPFGQYLVDAAIRAGNSDITSWGESLGIKASAISDYRCARRKPNGKLLNKWAVSLNLSGDERLIFYLLSVVDRAPAQIRGSLLAVPDRLQALQSQAKSLQSQVDELESRLKTLEAGG